MQRLEIHGCLVVWLAVVLPVSAVAGEGDGIGFFEQKIRPVLVKECYTCHSADAKKLKGGLRLDTRAGVLAGGDSGPAVVPGKVDESLLIDALRHDGLEMPPKSKLPDAVVADFERWITMGAPDPRGGEATPVRVGIDLEAGRRFWSYQPPRRHAPPALADAGWSRTDIDRFLLAALEGRGLRPVGDADRATLLRRLAFDLVGLPPSSEEIDSFVADPAPDAYERLVDRLLSSPRFGERWGRHWLDVVRFGESLTLRGFVLKEAWRYRDYVIDAFNADMPYNQFIEEQIAGDLLAAAGVADKRRQRIATTVLVLGNNNLEEQDKAQLRMDVVDEQLDTIGKAFLAQTIGCARCHDHKFDPIPTRDYYALAGVLRNTKALETANISRWLELPLPVEPEREAELQRNEAEIAALETRINQLRKDHGLVAAKGAITPAALAGVVVFERNGQGYVLVSNEGTTGTVVADAVQFLPVDAEDASREAASSAAASPGPKASVEIGALEAKLKRLKSSALKREMVMSVVEEPKIEDTRVHIRGSVHNLGEPAPRGFLRVANPQTASPLPDTESGRRELAAWLAAADNPLTARVIVNRVWHWLFGVGLVRTTDNFGTTGETPSHPELLDDLAVHFMEDGWSIKTLVRRIVLSRAYQTASVDDRRARTADPENRLLWRTNRRRLDAECIRDAILAVGGQLRQEMGGPGFPSEIAADFGFQHVGNRRSVYAPVFRNALPELFEAFDFADPSLVVGGRNVSTVAPQALYLLNHPFLREQARHAARLLLSGTGPGRDDRGRIERAYRRTLGRPPSDREREIAVKFLSRSEGTGASASPEEAWALLFQALFATIDFRYVD